MSDWERFMKEGRDAESEKRWEAAETLYDDAWRSARTVGEEKIAWRALRRAEQQNSEESGFISMGDY